MDTLEIELEKAKLQSDIAQYEGNIQGQYKPYWPIFIKLEERLINKASFYGDITNDKIRRVHRPPIQRRFEQIPLPFYEDPQVIKGTTECRRIIPWIWEIEDCETSVRLYYFQHTEENPVPPVTVTFFKNFDLWLLSKLPRRERCSYDEREFGIRMNPDDISLLFEPSKSGEQPIYTFIKIKDLKKLGVEPPPMPDQDDDERIIFDAFGRR